MIAGLAISKDLSLNQERLSLPIMGRQFKVGIHLGMFMQCRHIIQLHHFQRITTKRKSIFMLGTDDGLIHSYQK